MVDLHHTAYLSLGSNLGDKRGHLDHAMGEIERLIGHVIKRSAYIETPPWGFESTHTFYNACVAVSTELSPLELLRVTQQIERAMGRTTKSTGDVYHDRIIDIDILLYDDLSMHTPELVIPHPHLGERLFVLVPLDEIAHEKHIPGNSKSIGDMLSDLQANA